MDRFAGYSEGHEALAHAGLQGLLTALPVAAWLKTKEHQALGKVFRDVEQGAMHALKSGELPEAARMATRTMMREPMIIGAVIVAASMSHGAYRGYHRAKASRRQFNEHAERLSHVEQEDRRRQERQQSRSEISV